MRPPADAIGTLALIVGVIALVIFIGVEGALLYAIWRYPRMNSDQITARIATGAGGMPSFAGSLTPSELDDLTAFLVTRH